MRNLAKSGIQYSGKQKAKKSASFPTMITVAFAEGKSGIYPGDIVSTSGENGGIRA